ncbi:MAG: prolyl oligopeptidase family serine peptidase [Armatimonadetes bacterium]|nr:prolyl oligopeptidase family serine peptidase [Armatimonadota bacterium]
MKRFGLSMVLAFASVVAFGQAEVPSYATQQEYEFSKNLGGIIDPLILNDRVSVTWSSNGVGALYRWETAHGEWEWKFANCITGNVVRAFDHSALASALRDAEVRNAQEKRLNLQVIFFDSALLSMEFSLGQNRWEWRDREKKLTKLPASERPGQQRRGNISPDGKWRIETKDFNLRLVAMDGSSEIALTEDGKQTDFFASALWSPDSSKVLAMRRKPGDRKDMYRITVRTADDVRPSLTRQPYDLPGDKLDADRWVLIDIPSGKVTDVQAREMDFPWDRRVFWSADSRYFVYYDLHRGYQQVDVNKVSASDGSVASLLSDSSKTFVDPNNFKVERSPDGKSLYWLSERSGWNQIYKIDCDSGKIDQLTDGKFVVNSYQFPPGASGDMLVEISGRESGNPYNSYWYRLDQKSKKLSLLTPGDGHHTASVSPDGRWVFDAYSRPDFPFQYSIRDASNGKEKVSMGACDASAFLKAGFEFPKPYITKDRDGKFDIYGLAWVPSKRASRGKLPVIEYIYAGPHGHHTPTSFAPYSRNQMIAEMGFYVYQVDGRGTNGRGKAFQDYSYQNLGDAGLPDHMKWAKEFTEIIPEMDLTQGVGIYGYSAGGYDSTRALIAHPDYYKAAVSLCGNHDHRTDKVWWNELWMGYPITDAYKEQSNIENAAKIEGDLLVIAGLDDDNVNPFAGTMQLVDALVKADKRFDMKLLPGRNHNLGGWYVDRMIIDHFLRHFQRKRDGMSP